MFVLDNEFAVLSHFARAGYVKTQGQIEKEDARRNETSQNFKTMLDEIHARKTVPGQVNKKYLSVKKMKRISKSEMSKTIGFIDVHCPTSKIERKQR